jgi:YVTN family beta-propeller protein
MSDRAKDHRSPRGWLRLFSATGWLLLVLAVLQLSARPARADGPSLGGVGGIAIAYNPHDGYVYVLNANDSVSLLDGTRVVTTIDLPTGSHSHLRGLAVAPNGDVYIAQWFYDQVIVLRDGRILGIVPRQNDGQPGVNGIENGPSALAANPVNGLVYVATSWDGEPSSNGVAVLDGLQLVAHVHTGTNPQALAVHSGTGHVYVANAGSDTVTVIDGSTILAQIPVGDFPVALGVDETHGLVYVANRNAGTVSLIDAATRAVVATIPSGTGPLALAVDDVAGRAYVVNRDAGTVAVIDGLSRTRLATPAVGDNPLAIAATPGGVFVANQVDGTLALLQGTSVTATLPVGGSPVALAWDPDDGLYVVNFGDATLSLVRGSSVVATITDLPPLAHAALASLPNGHVAVADLTGHETWFLDGTQVITHARTVDQPLRLTDTPARAHLYSIYQVAHRPIAVDDLGRVFVATHQAQAVSMFSEAGGRLQSLWLRENPYDLEAMPGSGRVYAAVGSGVAVLQGSPSVTYTLLSGNLEGARALAAWPERGEMVVARSPLAGQAQISVIDDDDLSVTAAVDVCEIPAAIDIDRDAGLVYVSCSGSDSVGVLAGSTWLGEVDVGQFPQGLAVNPLNGYAYVAVQLANRVAVLDGLTLIASIPVPPMPSAVDVDPDTGRVYVTTQVGDTVAVIEGATLLTTVPSGRFPDAVLAQPHTGRVYVSSAHDGALDMFQLQTLAQDPGNDWPDATTIQTDVVYAAPIQDEADVDWYRLRLDQPGAQITLTLGGLALDYDLAFFNPLTGTAALSSTIETLDLGQVTEDGQLQSLSSWVDLGQLRSLPFRGGGARMLGVNDLVNVETLADRIWEPGDYYVAVWGHNGAYDAQPYALQAEIAPPTQPFTPAQAITATIVPPPLDTGVRALILTHGERLRDRYGLTATLALTGSLESLAGAVSGTLIYLEDFEAAEAAYAQWDAQPENPLAANIVSDVIKQILTRLLRDAYPNAEYLVLVGSDNILPFRRVPDRALIANERGYNAWVAGGTPMGGRIRGGYILSDDYYASFHPLPGPDRPRYVPEIAIGRLVETPDEIMAAVNAFLSVGPSVSVTRALVTGYDFLVDEAGAIAARLGDAGVTVTPLVNDVWTADSLRPLLLDTDHDVLSLNGHFNHRLMVAADASSTIARSEIAGATADYAGDVVFTVGCQSGLNVPDEDALGSEVTRTQDFAQAFLGRGAVYIANTGYGYGDSDAIGYSENLALAFTRELAQGDGTVGQAFMRAKQAYYAEAGYASFGDYDEKALIESTLYGLPMLRVTMPAQRAAVAPAPAVTAHYLGPVVPASRGLYGTLPVTLTPTFQPLTSTREIAGVDVQVGRYYVAEDGAQISPGRPLQPRTSVDLRAALPAGQIAHGALFRGGRYSSEEGFDPVISRVVSDTIEPEPPFSFQQWYPMPMQVLNRLQLGDQIVSEKLVVMPAQYRAHTAITGTQRLYHELVFEVYYVGVGATQDFSPPAIQEVGMRAASGAIEISAQVVDPSGVARVVVAYDEGAGSWQVDDLSPGAGTAWSGRIPATAVQAFVQAVDQAGNVSTSDNKRRFFNVVGLSLDPSRASGGRLGGTVVYTHTLVNTGSAEDSYRLGTISDGRWLVEHRPILVTLGPGISTTVAVTVTVPTTATVGSREALTLTARSLSQNVSESVSDATTALAGVYLPLVVKNG